MRVTSELFKARHDIELAQRAGSLTVFGIGESESALANDSSEHHGELRIACSKHNCEQDYCVSLRIDRAIITRGVIGVYCIDVMIPSRSWQERRINGRSLMCGTHFRVATATDWRQGGQRAH